MTVKHIPITLAHDWLSAPTAIKCEHDPCTKFAACRVDWMTPAHGQSPPCETSTYMCDEHLNQYLQSDITVHQLIRVDRT